jgi:hypothetical protein
MPKLFGPLLWLMLWSSTFPVAAQTCKVGVIPQSAPTGRFIDKNDGTVSDTQTRLMWKKCSEGQTSSDCSGGALVAYNWQEALQLVELVANINSGGGFANHTDWRLPNIKELRSIVEQACTDPVINLNDFPNTPSGEFWSSSPRATVGNYAWFYDQ